MVGVTPTVATQIAARPLPEMDIDDTDILEQIQLSSCDDVECWLTASRWAQYVLYPPAP